MHRYDYSFLHSLPLSQGLSSLLSAVRQGNVLLTRQLKQAPAQFKKTLLGTDSHYAADLPELRFPSYRRALKEANQLLDASSLRVEDILHIHSLLLPEDAVIKAENSQALALAVSAYNNAVQENADPLLLIPCMVLDLICLSPFQTGSHCTALLLARGLLCSSGFETLRYLDLERKICRFYFYYERALAQSSMHWAENGSDYLPYLEAFLSLHYLAGQDAQSALPSPKFSKREQIELFVLGNSEPVSKAQIGAALPDISLTTIEAVLGAMVKAGSIQRLGMGRATRYLKA